MIDVQRAAVVERDAEVVIAAEGVVPRQPVTEHWRLVAEERLRLEDHLLVRAEHLLRVDDPFRRAGRSRREQDFCHRLGSNAPARFIDGGGRRRRAQFSKGCEQCRYVARREHRHHFRVRAHDRAEGRRKRLRIGDEHQLGIERRADRPQRQVLARGQRIRGRERRIRLADQHRGESQQRVIDAITGEDHDRPVWR